MRIFSKGKGVRDLAFKTLALVLHATRSLTVAELLEALSVDEWSQRDLENVMTTSDMLESCANLVIVEEGNQTIHFIHQCVHEYLLNRTELPSIPDEIYLAKICITYLNFDEFQSGPVEKTVADAYLIRLANFPFLEYAAKNWTVHVKGDGENDPAVQQRLLYFGQCRLKFDNMLQARHAIISSSSFRLDNYPRFATIFHVIAGEGLIVLAEWLLSGDRDKALSLLQCLDEYRRTPLHYASIGGHTNIVQLFLRFDNTLSRCEDTEGATPLHRAAEAGSAETVTILLTTEADIAAVDHYGYDPLQRAIMSPEPGVGRIIVEQMFTKLKKGGGLTSSPDSYRKQSGLSWTLLHQMAFLGYEVGVKWLVQAGSDPYAEDRYQYAPIHRAAVAGHMRVVKFLATVTHCNHSTFRGLTCLHLAARHGHEDLIEMLLNDFNMDPCIRDNIGFTALHWAAAGGKAATVAKLLKVTDLILPAELAPSPFHLACWGDYPEVKNAIVGHYWGADSGIDMQVYDSCIRTVDNFNMLGSGTRVEASEEIYKLRQVNITSLLKHWAGMEFLRGRAQTGTAWLDLDLIFIQAERPVHQVSDIQHHQYCDHCCLGPIRGYRHRCKSCLPTSYTYDLCSSCFNNVAEMPHPHKMYCTIPSTFPLRSVEEQLRRLEETYRDEVPASF